MIVEQVLTRGLKHKYGLDQIVERYFGETIDKSIRKSFVDMQYGDDFSEDQIEYSGKDIQYLHKIKKIQLKQVNKYKLQKVISLENKTISSTGDMELNGLFLNTAKWLALEEKAIEERENISAKLDEFFIPIYDRDLLGHANINYNSPKQLLEGLRKLTGLDLKSTGEDYLSEFHHPVIKQLLEYRGNQKLISTYGSSFLEHIHALTHRIHSNFLQVNGTDSGRYSSQDPNLQNLPALTEYRAAFTAQLPDWKIVGADYSGMEMRLLAELSLDEQLLRIFDNDLDIHAEVGQMIFDKVIRAKGTNGPQDPGENTDLRRISKTLDFGYEK
jgi:DNA polymerase I-like protein with 3'-5' exonuclease and polymerase domains